MNLAYTEISNEEADRIIKSANLKTLAALAHKAYYDDFHLAEMNEFAESILSN